LYELANDDLKYSLCQQSRLQRLLDLCIDAGIQSGLGSGTAERRTEKHKDFR
jgi:hypothetical protein